MIYWTATALVLPSRLQLPPTQKSLLESSRPPHARNSHARVAFNESLARRCADHRAKKAEDHGYLFYSAHSGWGNQQVALGQALRAAHAMRRTLVLPPRLGKYDGVFGDPKRSASASAATRAATRCRTAAPPRRTSAARCCNSASRAARRRRTTASSSASPWGSAGEGAVLSLGCIFGYFIRRIGTTHKQHKATARKSGRARASARRRARDARQSRRRAVRRRRAPDAIEVARRRP